MWMCSLLSFPATAAIQAETFGAYVIEGVLKPQNIQLLEEYKVYAQKLLGFALLC